jgi:hypothetical protein
MSAAPRTASTTPDLRNLGVALGAVLAGVAIVAIVALARPAATTAPSIAAAPAAQYDHGTSSVPVFSASQFDHGTSAATSGADSLNVGANRPGGIQYIPYQAVQRNIVVLGTHGGGVVYNGIPSSPLAGAPDGGRGTRIAQ